MPTMDAAGSWKTELEFARGCDLNDGLRRISAMLEAMDGFLSAHSALDPAGMADLRLVCDEIGSNVVRYSARDKDVRLGVEISVTPQSVRLRMTDDGGEFNPFNQAVPYLGGDIEKRRVGGLGLYLISQLFPLADYRRVDDRNVSEVEYILGKDGKKKMRRNMDRAPGGQE